MAVDGAGWGLQGVLLLHAVEQGLPAQVNDFLLSPTFDRISVKLSELLTFLQLLVK